MTELKIDKNGFVNLNIRLHKDDFKIAGIYKVKITDELQLAVAKKMNSQMNGGDTFFETLKNAYESVKR